MSEALARFERDGLVDLDARDYETPRPLLRWLFETATAGVNFDPEGGLDDSEDTGAVADAIADTHRSTH